jgi:type II pantothenate kinase
MHMTHAGIDIGSTLTKAVWAKSDGKLVFASTADRSLDEIFIEMKADGVTTLIAAGLGNTPQCDFSVIKLEGDAIANELRQQVIGVRKLLKMQNKQLSEFLLTSVGTGTSYTYVAPDKIQRYFPGNCIGGGFIYGMLRCLGADMHHFEKLGLSGTPKNLLVKDVSPETLGTPLGNLIVASFGTAYELTLQEDVYATLFSTAAVLLIRDIIMINMTKDFPLVKDTVFIGSTLRSVCFQNMLSNYASEFGVNIHFLQNGEYALALGAYTEFDLKFDLFGADIEDEVE